MEYGRRVTPEALRMIERAEDSLRGLGLKAVPGAASRLDWRASKLRRRRWQTLLQMGENESKWPAVVRAAGFRYVSLDCEATVPGSMNRGAAH